MSCDSEFEMNLQQFRIKLLFLNCHVNHPYRYHHQQERASLQDTERRRLGITIMKTWPAPRNNDDNGERTHETVDISWAIIVSFFFYIVLFFFLLILFLATDYDYEDTSDVMWNDDDGEENEPKRRRRLLGS